MDRDVRKLCPIILIYTVNTTLMLLVFIWAIGFGLDSYHHSGPLHLKLFNSLNAELNPIRHLLALVGARHIVHVSRIRVNMKCCNNNNCY